MTSGPHKPISPALPPKRGKWTDDQWRGITETGKSLLVSAAAGSGKTAVLAERCAHLVCDADPCCGVDELLVVTFTEAAAAEMKSRIEQVLRERLAKDPTSRLARQLALMDHAQISTLHAFCSRVLRQHFHLAGIDPNFTILDGDESALLRLEVCRELFHDRYENDESGRFQKFIDVYADGDDERLVQRIVRTHELLCSLVDPDGWRKAAHERIAEAIELPLEQSRLGKDLVALMRDYIASLLGRIHAAADTIKSLAHFDKYLQDLGDLRRTLEHWSDVLEEHGIDALAEESRVELPRLPAVSNSVPGKELAKGLMDGIRKDIKEGALTEMLRFSSQQWKDGLREVLPFVEVYLGLVEEFAERYAGAKAASRSLDFNDLERLALRVLCDGEPSSLEPSAVAAGYQHQFHYVLVDEYQDINEVQDAILTLVSRERRSEEAVSSTTRLASGDRKSEIPFPNFFCVGDVKQSIYRFRLAEPARFLRRQRRFLDDGVLGAVIDLQANFRSRAPLLEAINAVFARLMSSDAAEIEYDATHELRPGLPYPPGEDGTCFNGSPIELHLLPSKSGAEAGAEAEDDAEEFDRTENEARLIAQRIHEMMGRAGGRRMQVMEKTPAGDLRPRPIRYGDAVVLLRSMRHKADQFAEVLRRSGIPVHSASATGYFESTEVRDMLALLRLLDNARQDVPMAAVLRSPLVGLAHPEDCLARIRLAYPGKPEPVPFHQAVVRYSQEQDDELAARLRDLLNDLRRWRDLAHQRPLAELIWTVYEETGFLAFCSGLDDGDQRSANLLYLHERARQFGTFHRQGLARFMQFLQSLQNESDLGQPSVASEADDVVRVMSIHKSKGLEFPVVFLPDLGKAFNLQDCHGPVLVDRSAYLGLSVVDETKRIRYPSLASLLVQQRIRRQSLAEELRVLYVAMTRAREHLVMIGTCKDGAPEKWEARWGKHQGPVPADEVVRARTMLDWIGPVEAAARGSGRPVFEAIRHATDEIGDWNTPAEMRPKLDDMQQRLVRLEPLDPPPASAAEADEVIRRLTFAYPHHALSQVPATLSVTGWTKRQGGAAPKAAAGGDGLLTTRQPLALPTFLSEESAVSPLDAGTATHTVLQHLQFTGPCDEADVRAQIDSMVARRLLSPAHAASVEVEAVCWLMRGQIGALLRENAKVLRRELPLYFAAPPALFNPAIRSDGPADDIMVRGRIDVLIPTPPGLVIVDYKTDRIPPDMLPSRIETYRPQVRMYREAIERLAERPVTRVHLAFLTARKIETM